jgi:pyruvate/2-oxoglutarate dehydrogenase complex dihydrolipoamide acyltransferase (E2) component
MPAVKMTRSYTPEVDRRGVTLYAGSEYPVSDEVAQEIRAQGVGELVAEGAEEVSATDAAKREAAERGVSLKRIKGSGSDGQVTVEDVKKEGA